MALEGRDIWCGGILRFCSCSLLQLSGVFGMFKGAEDGASRLYATICFWSGGPIIF